MPAWVTIATHDYIKRMPTDCSIAIKELKPALNSAKDAIHIEAAIPKGAHVIALDERGTEVTTLQLSERMTNWLGGGRDISLIIGGADGLHPDIKKNADWLWSLSKLTLPHGMVRVVLAEQLYRAWTVINHHPYHRE